VQIERTGDEAVLADQGSVMDMPYTTDNAHIPSTSQADLPVFDCRFRFRIGEPQFQRVEMIRPTLFLTSILHGQDTSTDTLK